MKIAIYDKWLHTLGGGEKVATVMAEVLSKDGHEVDLISSFEIDRDILSEMMGVDLSKVNLVVWYERSAQVLFPKTKKYDLFINLSFLDHTPSSAKKSVYYVLFPTPIKRTLLGFLKYETILPVLRRFLLIPEVFSGLNPIEDVYTRGGKWLREKNTIVFSNTPSDFILKLSIYAEKLKANTLDEVEFSSSNVSVEVLDKYVDHNTNVLTYKLHIKGSENPALIVRLGDSKNLNSYGLVSMTVRNLRFFAWNVIKKFLPEYEMALYGSSEYKPAEGLETYDKFWTISEFSKKWTKIYWGKEADILSPPIETEQFSPGSKKNLILNVGRFFVGGHSKRQDILLEVFKEMVDKKEIEKSWELHFVGGVAGGEEHAKYVRDLEEKAQGYNVKFHLFASFEKLKKLYSQAKIYWHGTGYGESESSHPIRLEHFGITPLEAMASGAVPIVYSAGGPKEVVDAKSGFVWKNKEQLKSMTIKLTEDDKLRKSKAQHAQKKATNYSIEEFEKKLKNIVDDL